MKTWKISGGDVASNPKARVEYVDGPNKVVQDLRNWILNDIGYNKFHSQIGTTLDSYVGQPVSSRLLAAIRDVIRTALNTYLEMQMDDLKARIEERGDPITAIGMAEPSSMVKSWTYLDVNHDYTTIIIRIGFRTFTDDYDEVVLSLENGLRTGEVS